MRKNNCPGVLRKPCSYDKFYPPTYKEFLINMEDKMQDDEFLGDTQQLLRPDEKFDPVSGYELVKRMLIDRLQQK